ncbi:hypothetical protein [Aeromonas hydrophila]|uniref:hypothetical protein n=1 Tax=Aeromonas hydrophila TaxID=644 RepID=UPI002B4A4617|nr:hypothetical protein [Aeromonas hydrophila]
MSDKFKVANVFTESEIQIGSLSVDDFQKIRSEARRDLTLHGWQWLNAGTVAYRTYFATMKCFIFAFGLVLALLFIFGGKGFDANVTELHDIIMNGLPVDKASELPEFYWAVLCVLGLILTSSAQVACMAAFMAVAASYINLFTDKINIFKSEVNKYICKLSGLLGVKLANQEVADNNEDPVLYRRPLPFPHSLGYNDYFHESIEKKIKVLLQEQTDSPIVVKIKNDPVMS